MDFMSLANKSSAAIFEIDLFINKYGSSQSLESIKSQMRFILDAALSDKNPLHLLPKDKPFTYSVLASREFASPEEMKIKACLDEVSKLLDAG